MLAVMSSLDYQTQALLSQLGVLNAWAVTDPDALDMMVCYS